MLTARDTEYGIDSAASTVPMPRVATLLQLSARTLTWLTDRPRAREWIRSVWDKLAELEQAGHHSGAITALRFVLVHPSRLPTPGAAGLGAG